MTMIPHSGNKCSGLCEVPCRHDGCWQCKVVMDMPAWMAKEATRLAALDVQKKERKHPQPKTREQLGIAVGRDRDGITTYSTVTAPVRPNSILAGAPAQQQKDHQKTYITRAALEGLCAKAGVSVAWNEGDPIITEDRQSHRLNSGIDDSHAIRAAVQRIANSAAITFEGQVQQIMGHTLEEDLRRSVDYSVESTAKMQDRRARDVLKAQGASDEDIDAAEGLLKWKPPEVGTKGKSEFVTKTINILPTLDRYQADYVKKYFARLDSEMVGISTMRRIIGNDNV